MPILDEDFLSLYSNILSGFLGMLFAFLKQYSDGKPVANQVQSVKSRYQYFRFFGKKLSILRL